MLCLSTKQSLSPAICLWDEARVALDAAMTKYLGLCCALEASSLRQDASTKDLSTRIDLALETFHVKLEQHTARARSTLADTRNRIASPIYRVPREILSEIFTRVIYAPSNLPGYRSCPMALTLISNYREIYRLLGVCSAWRTIILAKGSFWSIIPIIKPNFAYYPGMVIRHPCSTSLSLQRAGVGDLHLAVVSQDYITEDITDLTHFAPQFRTINVKCEIPFVVRRVLDYFLDHNFNRLTDLSVFVKSRELNNLPREKDYIFPSDDHRQRLFEQLVKSLSILRIRGMLFHLTTALLSSQLVELHLQELTLGRDSKLIELLSVLPSISGLRHLRLISVKTFPENKLVPITVSNIPILLPALQTLLVQDLYANTLHLLLSTIASRTHRTTLYLTEKWLQIQLPREERPDAIDMELVGLSNFSYTNDLIVNSTDRTPMQTTDLRKVIISMPNLETLRMVGWNFDRELCEALIRPQYRSSRSFPRIKHIHLYSVVLYKPYIELFKIMMTSHFGSLEQVILDGGIEENAFHLEGFDHDDDIVVWLEQNVPKFELSILCDGPYECRKNPPWLLWHLREYLDPERI